MIATLLTQDKGIAYQIGYWVTALLPVILGFGITLLLVWYLTKTYKGNDDDEADYSDEFKDN